MAAKVQQHLSRRERQIMDVVYARGEASVGDVVEDMPDPSSYSSVRTLMRILEDKGHLRHRPEGIKYVYMPTRPRHAAAKSAVRQMLSTFFDDSASKAVAALLDVSDARLTKEELNRMCKLINQARSRSIRG